ncbi:hypothetical protein [Ectobacillus ponti]|uniref:YtkA-like domain-containing protein n=1 Tax=Ectobacillus ponti TaxID=2961894 RepID=A0AA41X893_9BACI|nr:hypothetical protein [Ectobacillus ponti]MCP8968705.1 hypothetical protein [Ectobacillus ponti]
MKRAAMAVGGLLALFILAFYLQRSGLSGQKTETAAGVDQVVWDVKNAEKGKEAKVSFIMQNERGEAFRGLGDTARGAVRAVIVPPSLAEYEEVRPASSGAGTFSFSYTFKQTGEYAVFAYVKNKDGHEAVSRTSVKIGTDKKETKAKLAPSPLLSMKVGPYEASLVFPALRPGQPSDIVFQFTPQNRKELSFQSASGQVSSLLLLDENRKHLLYAEPVRDEKGKELVFSVTFPEEGMYKMWASLYVDGKPYEKTFVLHVAKPKS